MTIDLWILLAVAGLQWTLIMTASTPRLLANGIPWSLANRETPSADVPPWAQRAQRASDNLQENIAIFAVVVLVVHVAGAANELSALGAQIFLGGRLAHAALYIGGVKVVRTLAWAVSIVGIALMVSTLF